MPQLTCPFCLYRADVPDAAAVFACAGCGRAVASGEAWNQGADQIGVAATAAYAGALVAGIDLAIGFASLPPPPPNPADRGNDGPALLLSACVVFLGVASAVGQWVYRRRGDYGSREFLRREWGRAVECLDAACALLLIGRGAYLALLGGPPPTALGVGLALLARLAVEMWRNYRSAAHARIVAGLTDLSAILAAARREADRGGRAVVGVPDVILSVAQMSERPVAGVLARFGVTAGRLRGLPGPGADADAVGFAAAVGRAVERAAGRARQKCDLLTKPEHLLLALLAEPDGAAVVRALGADGDGLRRALVERVRRLRPRARR